ncbi:MAG: DUF11 domain-containing protein, partial [Actinomycetia bacterium]|nr:DUF11 domain-containing protein [Actinomycetes bacterium]
CSATYTVSQTDVDNGQIDNTAQATGSAPNGAGVTATDNNTVTTPQNPSIRLLKTVNPPDPVPSVGDVLAYDFTVTNDGDVTLTDIDVSDPLPGLSAITCGSSTLLPGDITNCSATYTVDQNDVDNGVINNTAVATGTAPNGTDATDTDSALVSPGQAPAIALDKDLDNNADEDGSGGVSAGDTLTYTFAVSNTGNVTLSAVSVTDPLAGLSAVTCPVTTIVPGATIICTATYTVTQADVDAGTIASAGEATGTPPLGPTVSDSDPHSTPVPQSPSIRVVKTVDSNADEDGSGGVSAGDTLTYSFAVTNNGNVNLTAVDVSDPMPGLSGVSCGSSALAPGASTSCSATYSVTQADVDRGSIDNIATTTGSAPNGAVVTAADSVGISITMAPALDLSKTVGANADEDGSSDISRGDTLTYEFTATNTGNTTLTDLTVTDVLPGLSAITCASSTLVPGGTAICTASYSVTQADVDVGAIPNTADASTEAPGGDPGDPSDDITATDSVVTGVPRTPAIDLVKDLDHNADEDGSGDISLGDTLTYTYDVTNAGNTTLTTVVVTDPLPGLSVVTCPVATLLPGDTTICTAPYLVTQNDIDNGQITSTGRADADAPNGVGVVATDPHTASIGRTPGIDMAKTQSGSDDADGSGTISRGDTLTYSFALTNTGNVTLTGLAINDPLSGLSPVSCPTATLAPGGTTTCTATYAVVQADVDAGQIDNLATASGAGPDGGTVTATATATVNPVQTPLIDLVKALTDNADEDGSGNISLGDTLTYSFTVANPGTVTLSGVTVTDPLPGLALISCPGTTLVPGASMVCTTTYSVTQADVDAGTIDSTGKAVGTPPTGPDVSSTDPHTVSLDAVPGLSLAKDLSANADEDGSGTISRGDTLTYDFTTTNTGNTTLTDLTVTDPLP